MKKKIIATITMLCLLTVLYNYLRLPDYHITNSISFSSADTRDTELTVIVYTIIANHSELQPLNIIKKNSTLLLLLK